jgi:hypothetical protein
MAHYACFKKGESKFNQISVTYEFDSVINVYYKSDAG